MDQIYYKVEGKQEQFEEHLVTETESQCEEENSCADQLEFCCLCSEGSALQSLLVEHLQLKHQNGRLSYLI